MTQHDVPHSSERFCLSTEQFADRYLVAPQTVRKQLSQSGSYFGVRPLRLPNRKLLWPSDSLQSLVAKELA